MTGDVGEHYKDLRATRRQAKRRRAAQKKKDKAVDPERCYDWMVQSGASYARDRTAFTQYIPIEPVTLRTIYNAEHRVIGVGIVQLKVLRDPSSTEISTITLSPVLHMPDAICNGIKELACAASMHWRSGQASFFDEHDLQIFYATPFSTTLRLMRIALAGDPRGVSPLGGVQNATLSCFLLDEDQNALNRAIGMAIASNPAYSDIGIHSV